MPQLVKSKDRQQVRTSPHNQIKLLNLPRVSAAPFFRGRLCASEWRRRLWHISPGFLPFLLWVIPHQDPANLLVLSALTAVSISLLAAALHWSRTFLRPGEGLGLDSIVGYAASVLPVLLLFPAQIEIGLTTLAILAFGDGSATLVGMHVRGRSLPWNPRKTWVGSASFVMAATIMASIIYWGEANPRVPFATGLIISASAALVAAAAESFASRINDNIRVGLAAAATLATMQGLLVGWN